MHLRNSLPVLLAALIAGTNGLMIKFMSSMTAGSIAWFRAIIPLAIISMLMQSQRITFFKAPIKIPLLASGLNAVRMYLYLVAFIYTSIGNAVIIFYSWPIFVSILGFLFLKEKITCTQIGLLIMAFTGLILAYSNKPFSFDT